MLIGLFVWWSVARAVVITSKCGDAAAPMRVAVTACASDAADATLGGLLSPAQLALYATVRSAPSANVYYRKTSKALVGGVWLKKEKK